jgi:hypothetical protein
MVARGKGRLFLPDVGKGLIHAHDIGFPGKKRDQERHDKRYGDPPADFADFYFFTQSH